MHADVSAMPEHFFASDNVSGIHPKILEAIARANHGHAPAYGEDRWTEKAIQVVRDTFDTDAEVFFTFNGTGANVIGLAASTRPHHAVLCAKSAHLWTSECAAPERFFGGKLIPIEDRFGKLTPEAVAPYLKDARGVHTAQARVISLTQPTEWGTLYTVDEIRAFADFAASYGLLLHIDGARYANAAAALDVTFAELTTHTGVDILSLGGTKNGLLGGEAVLILNDELATEAAYARKQAMQLASKMRFIAAQFLAYLEEDLWRVLAKHANSMAQRLARALGDVRGLEFVCPVECNMLFPRLPPRALESLQNDFYFYAWDQDEGIARWVTSFDTTEEDIDSFAVAVKDVLS